MPVSINPGSLYFALSLVLLHPVVQASGTTRTELDRLQERISRLSDALNQDRAELNSEQQALAQIEKSMAELNRKLHGTHLEIDKRIAGIKASEAGIFRIEADLDARREQLKDIVVASYVSGRAEYFKVLLNQENPAHVGRFLAYYRYLSRHRVKEILEFESAMESLGRARSDMEAEQRELKALEKAQLAKQKDLENARGERRALVAALEEGIGSKEQQLERMHEDAARLSQLLQSIRENFLHEPDVGGPALRFEQMRGRLSLPLRGRISARFGQARWGTDVTWRGIFMDALEGAEVSAIFPGRVAFADWLRGFGLLLILDHGDGFMSLYSHNQLLFKQVGEWVEQGETIALVGSSGGQPRSGLYFEIRRNGEPQNPLIWCKVE